MDSRSAAIRPAYRLWILGGVIVVLAFAAGVGARSLLSDDDGDAAISDPQAAGIRLGISRAELNARLGGREPSTAEPTPDGGTCLAYPSSDTDRTWVFCLRDDRLFAKRQIGSP
jgi:hypothetical protein